MAKKLYGTDPDQVPTNADLGTMAYQDSQNAVMVDPLFAHDDSRQAKFKRIDGSWSTIEINAGSTTGNSRIAFTDPDTENQVAQNTADGMIDYEHSGDSLRFYTDQSLAAQFTSSGNLLFPDGQGIDFSSTGDGSGSMTSELLADYEEGTWTPVYSGSSVSGTGTYTRQSGVYVRVGDLVYASCTIGISAHTGSGAAEVTGLPYAAMNNTGNYAGITVSFNSGHAHTSGYQIIGFIQVNTAGIKLWETGGTGQQNVLALDTSFSEFDFSIVYRTT